MADAFFSSDPFQSNGYAPIHMECDQAHVPVEGQWPRDLSGSFYRIGPNPQFAPRGRYNPLNGDGMVHAFHVRDGRIAYRNRWVRTQQWQLEHAAGRALFGTSGLPTDSDPSVAGLRTDGVANTNLVWHGNRLLALEEGHRPIELNPDTLATVGRWSFDGKLPRNMTAHPKVDPVTGEMLLFANFENRRQGSDVGFHVADASGAIVHSTTVHGPFAALIHDFATTRAFAIFIYCPVTVSMQRAMAGGPPLAWEPSLGVQVGVMPRRGDAHSVRWFSGAPCMAWHVMNAFNEGTRIVLDLCQQDAPMFPTVDGAAPDHRRASQLLTRWTLDWSHPGGFTTEQLHDAVCEYPRIDERRVGLSYRHGFVACLGGPGTDDLFQRGIGHFDLQTRQMQVYAAGARCAVSEPLFVPRHAGAAEGDGYVLTNIFDEARNASHLAVFDARDIGAGPLARAHLDHRVPVGFHACWRPAPV